jgi:hypothetical protein
MPYSYRYLRPEIYRHLSRMGVQQGKRLAAACPYDDPTDCKDHLYINERFFSYQNPLSHIKRRIFEERNPLLDKDIIEFVRRLPPALRIWKALFKMAARHIIPEFDQIGVARYISLVDWDQRLQSDAALQAFVRLTLLNQTSEFHQWVDPAGLSLFLDKTFAPKMKRRSIGRLIRRKIRERWDRYELLPSEEIFRLMILKIWVEENLKSDFDLKI